MFKSSGSRDLQLICVAFAIVFAIGVESANSTCDPNCAGTCVKFPAGGCDKTCNATWGLNTTSHTCGPCHPKCALTSPCNRYGPGTCEIACKPGYCRQNYTCVAVPHCLPNACTNGTAMPCTGCSPGYILANGECIKCDPNCDPTALCTSPYSCPNGSCNENYTSVPVPITTSDPVYACGACDAHCNGTCNDYGPGKCDSQCVLGWAVNNATHQCEQCSSNCVGGCKESGPGFCDCPCKPGYGCAPTPGDPTKSACYPP
jgi:hypothetical protein